MRKYLFRGEHVTAGQIRDLTQGEGAVTLRFADGHAVTVERAIEGEPPETGHWLVVWPDGTPWCTPVFDGGLEDESRHSESATGLEPTHVSELMAGTSDPLEDTVHGG